MSTLATLLILEDEPLILMDLQFAAEDRECRVLSAISRAEAFAHLEKEPAIDVAILDVSLGGSETCLPVAKALEERSIPYILHSGDLNRLGETIHELDAEFVAKPAAAEHVIGVAIARAKRDNSAIQDIAAE